MTALTQNEGRIRSDGDLVGDVPVAAGAHIRQGSLLEISATGYVSPATKGAGKTYYGVSQDEADNRSGADGALKVTTRLAGMFRFDKTGTAVRGKTAYVADDNTVTDVAAGASACGRIHGERDGQVQVYLSR